MTRIHCSRSELIKKKFNGQVINLSNWKRRYSNDNARESIESVITVSVKRERRVDSDYLVMRVTNRKRKKTHTILENI